MSGMLLGILLTIPVFALFAALAFRSPFLRVAFTILAIRTLVRYRRRVRIASRSTPTGDAPDTPLTWKK